MAVDQFIESLESEFVDGLMGSLQPLCDIKSRMMGMLKDEADWVVKERDAYEVFRECYQRLLDEPYYRVTKIKISEVDKKMERHSPHFEALKLYIRQIDTAIDSMGPFFELEDNNSKNYRERFKPFSGYLRIIEYAMEGIIYLNRIYANTVDTDKITARLVEEGRYHRMPESTLIEKTPLTSQQS